MNITRTRAEELGHLLPYIFSPQTPLNDAKVKGVNKSPVVKKTPCKKGYLEGDNSKSKLDNCQKIVEESDPATNILNTDRNSLDGKNKKNDGINSMEDKETCKCSRRVINGDSIRCDNCEFWFHPGCEKIKANEFKKISELGDITKWFCTRCKSDIENLIDDNKVLHYENLEFRKQNQMLKDKFLQIEREMTCMKISISDYDKSLSTIMKDEIAARIISYTDKIEKDNEQIISENMMIKKKVEGIEKMYKNKLNNSNLDITNEIKNIFAEEKSKNDLMNKENANIEQDVSNINIIEKIVDINEKIKKIEENHVNSYSKNLNKTDADILKQSKNIQERIDNVEKILEVSDKRQIIENEQKIISEMKEKIESELNNKMNENISKTLKKEEMKKDRLNNLIIFNMEESKEEQSSNREKEDFENAEAIIYHGVKVSKFTILKTIRLGKKNESNINDKPRPLLVKLANPGEKWKIISNARNLKYANEKTRKIGIMPDLDEEEKLKEKQLYELLKEKRNKGESGWYIYKNKLCRQQNFHESSQQSRN